MDQISIIERLAQQVIEANLNSSPPMRFVMTYATYLELQSTNLNNGLAVQQPKPSVAPLGTCNPIVAFESANGIPFEVFNTVRECLDRSVELAPNIRPVLILLEPIPSDCMDHPVLKMFKNQLGEFPPSLDDVAKNLDSPKFNGASFDEVFGSPGRRYRGQAPHIN